MLCRGCHEETGDEVLVDLGMQPLANRLLTDADRRGPNKDYWQDPVYPLAPVICRNGHCRLIQLPELPDGVGFGPDYPYRSGQSETWKAHLQAWVDATVTPGSTILEVGGNDGTLGDILDSGHTPGCTYLNVDPSATGNRYFKCYMRPGLGLDGHADYVFAANVAAHVPDLDVFFAGIHSILKPTGVLSVEVQDVNQLIERGEWDCIYHEHYSYFNAQTLCDAIERRGFFVEHIQQIPTHGGSVRVTARKVSPETLTHPGYRVPLRIPQPYPKWGDGGWYERHPEAVNNYHDDEFCDPWFRDYYMFPLWRANGQRVVGYGAPAKASTFLNYFKMGTQYIEYICDTTPEKQGRYTPGSHIEIKSPDVLDTDTPDIIVVLAWNWLSEIRPKLQAHIDRGVEIWCRGERIR